MPAFLAFTVCGTLIGMYFSKKLSDRTRLIESFVSALRTMSTYIRYNRMKLDEVFRRLTSEYNLPVSCELIRLCENGKPFHSEWENCISKLDSLSDSDKAILSALGEELGKSDTEGQLASIESAKELLSDNKVKAVIERDTKGRLYRTLGILLGATAGIIFI